MVTVYAAGLGAIGGVSVNGATPLPPGAPAHIRAADSNPCATYTCRLVHQPVGSVAAELIRMLQRVNGDGEPMPRTPRLNVGELQCEEAFEQHSAVPGRVTGPAALGTADGHVPSSAGRRLNAMPLMQ